MSQDLHPHIVAWLQGANPDDLQSAEDWTLEPVPYEYRDQASLFEMHAHPHDCNCPACNYDGPEEPDDEPADIDTDDPAEDWLGDSWAGAWDDDPSPYDGTYSED